MVKLIDIVDPNEPRYAKAVRVTFKNRPSNASQTLILESVIKLDEGTQKKWGDGYRYRLDRRPAHHGGDQVHIYGPKDAWAYRHTGARSEPNKYTTPANDTVKDIVVDVFGVPRDIIEANVISADDDELLIEISFR